MSYITVSTCNLNQWSLDFDGNCTRIIASIKKAKEEGAKYRLGPELEITGYGCQDHFLERDTHYHAWQSIVKILSSDITDGILCDIGLPILHDSVRYNCRMFILNRKIILIRPKVCLANDGNYREMRWFTAFDENHWFDLQEFPLPAEVFQATGQKTCPFGIAIIEARDTTIASETCEELFTPKNPGIELALNGVEIISNGSGSHHQLRKLNTRINLMMHSTLVSGGIYMYSNMQGCDGDRLYFDGSSMILMNGQLYSQASQFSVVDVEVITATLNLDEVRSSRASVPSRSIQAAGARKLPRVKIDLFMTHSGEKAYNTITTIPITVKYLTPEEEIAYGPACYLWDYLRRSGAIGYLLPLSGGADSASVCALVGVMCNLVFKAMQNGDEIVIQDVKRIIGKNELPIDPKELAAQILHTCYMGTVNSSNATRDRASKLASEIGSFHNSINIDLAVSAVINVFQLAFGKSPAFMSNGGSITEDLSLQNIQARLRMVFAYFIAQLLPWIRNKKGYLLVLGSANVDESLRGYMTKYDCSSADINPIGSISKGDVNAFLKWAGNNMGYKTLLEILGAPPTAELRPMVASKEGSIEHTQTDEEDMGMSYQELGIYGKLRKIDRCGPVSMFQKLAQEWLHLSPAVVAEKVKKFFYFYSINRHKMTTITPAYHAESYSPDDNRFDMRPFLYNTKWTRQFNDIDQLAAKIAKAREKKM